MITHAHADHVKRGHARYLCTESSYEILRARVGGSANIQTLPYRQPLTLGKTSVSFHPAGHILGSAQVRVATDESTWVVTGDYKLEPDPTCEPFESVHCDTLITEATFADPKYVWPDAAQVFQQINTWWRSNRDADRPSLILAYALGKAQRVLAGLDPTIAPIFTHDWVEQVNVIYRAAGVALPATKLWKQYRAHDADDRGAMFIASPSTLHMPDVFRAPLDCAIAVASGWCLGAEYQPPTRVTQTFVLSDHADWPGLLKAIEQSGQTCFGHTWGWYQAGAIFERARDQCKHAEIGCNVPSHYNSKSTEE